jgi:hypothetical protein
MDRNSLQLIINNDKAIHSLDRLLKDSGELHLICDRVNRERDTINREDLIRKMSYKNKQLAESIVNMAAFMSTLKHNPQSPMVQ